MMRFYDPHASQRLERELRGAAERARQVREAQTQADDVRYEAGQEEPHAVEVTGLRLVDSGCAICELEREQSSA